MVHRNRKKWWGGGQIISAIWEALLLPLSLLLTSAEKLNPLGFESSVYKHTSAELVDFTDNYVYIV